MDKPNERLALLTGAAGTIGRTAVKQLIGNDYSVIGVDLNKSVLLEMEKESGGRFHPHVADLGSEDDIDRCCRQIIHDHGRVHALINNAGILTTDKFLDTSLADLRNTMALNFESAFLMCQKLIPGMIEAGQGRIINISSFAGRSGGLLAGTAYSLSKAAMIGLTFTLAREFGPKGISTNAIAPAFVRSGMMRSAFKTPDDEKNLLASIPLRRLCEPEEVASAITYLASDLAGFINGEVIDINGGIQCD
jgi:3-oxoacyl-[acyl-carrier protein] reductase